MVSVYKRKKQLQDTGAYRFFITQNPKFLEHLKEIGEIGATEKTLYMFLPKSRLYVEPNMVKIESDNFRLTLTKTERDTYYIHLQTGEVDDFIEVPLITFDIMQNPQCSLVLSLRLIK